MAFDSNHINKQKTNYHLLLKQYKSFSREESINFLRIHSPKNQLQSIAYRDTEYLSHLSDKQLLEECRVLIRNKLNLIKKLKKVKRTTTDTHDYFNLYRPYRTGVWFIDRNKPHANKWTYFTVGLNNDDTKRNLQYNFNNIKGLIKSLFSNHNKVFVVRCDLYSGDERENDLNWLNYAFSKLQKETVYLFNGYLGYYCCREYTPDRGIHFHCYYFLDGNKIKNEIDFLKRIGPKWKRLTCGYVYCRNLDKSKLPDRGECLGRVDYWDVKKVEKLVFISKYLLKHLSNRDWLSENDSNRRLFSCSNYKNTPSNSTKRKWLIDFSFIDKMKLSDTVSLFSSKLQIDDYKKPNPEYSTATIPEEEDGENVFSFDDWLLLP